MTPTSNPTLLWFVIGYGLMMIILGIWFSRRIKSSDDFILAGRSLGPIILSGTLLATFAGSGTVTGGINSLAYSYGFWAATILSIPISFFGLGLLYLIAPKFEGDTICHKSVYSYPGGAGVCVVAVFSHHP